MKILVFLRQRTRVGSPALFYEPSALAPRRVLDDAYRCVFCRQNFESGPTRLFWRAAFGVLDGRSVPASYGLLTVQTGMNV